MFLEEAIRINISQRMKEILILVRATRLWKRIKSSYPEVLLFLTIKVAHTFLWAICDGAFKIGQNENPKFCFINCKMG